VKNLDSAIDRAENRNPTVHKFIQFHPHDDNPNIPLSDKDREHLDRFNIPDIMEKEKSKSPTPPPYPSGSAINYNKTTVEILPVDIDRSQY
jgi:hypothetical protein